MVSMCPLLASDVTTSTSTPQRKMVWNESNDSLLRSCAFPREWRSREGERVHSSAAGSQGRRIRSMSGMIETLQ